MKKMFFLIVHLIFLFPLFAQSSEAYYPEALTPIESRIDQLLDLGENKLFNGEFYEAYHYLSLAIDQCTSTPQQELRLCRALFSRALSNGALNSDEEAIADIHRLTNIFKSFRCEQVKNSNENIYKVKDKPLLGPDEIALEDCVKIVDNTEDYIKDILAFAPINTKCKVALVAAIHYAANEARNCCYAGGVWKACLQPLLTKWIDLKEWDRECRQSNRWFCPPE